MLRLTVSGNTFKDLRSQLQSAIDELEEENEESGQLELPLYGKIPDSAFKHSRDTSMEMASKILMSDAPQDLKDRAMEHMSNPPIVVPTFKEICEKIEQRSAASAQPTSDTDSRGIKWDARVHAATKELTDKGVWRRRRGITPQQMSEVESQQVNAPQAVVVQPVVVAPMVPPPPTAPQVVYESPIYPIAPVAVVAPVIEKTYENIPIPAISERKQAHDLASFKATLIPSITKLFNEGKITPEYITSLKTYFGVDEIWKVNDIQLAEMFKTFAENGLITAVGAQ